MECFRRGVRLNCVGFVLVSLAAVLVSSRNAPPQKRGVLRDETKTEFSKKESGVFHPPPERILLKANLSNDKIFLGSRSFVMLKTAEEKSCQLWS